MELAESCVAIQVLHCVLNTSLLVGIEGCSLGMFDIVHDGAVGWWDGETGRVPGSSTSSALGMTDPKRGYLVGWISYRSDDCPNRAERRTGFPRPGRCSRTCRRSRLPR